MNIGFIFRRSINVKFSVLLLATAIIASSVFALSHLTSEASAENEGAVGKVGGGDSARDEKNLTNGETSASDTESLSDESESTVGAGDAGKLAANNQPAQPNLPMSQPAGVVAFDYDGDGRADVSRFKTSNSLWEVRSSGNNTLTGQTLGAANGKIAPADYDGDGKTDFAIFDPAAGTFTILKSSLNSIVTVTLGQTSDVPVSADYDGDGRADAAVYRSSNGTWYYKSSASAGGNTIVTQQFGAGGDIPTPGNYDGDARADFAVFRPSNATWYYLRISDNSATGAQWGVAGDIPVAADYDGDGKTDIAVYRREDGSWYYLKSSTNNAGFGVKTWGNYGDQPVPADYDGDGKTDFAVWRPTTGTWYIVKSSDDTFMYAQLGSLGDKPTAAAYLKQTAAEVTTDEITMARISPKNATGGTNLYSRNFSWGASLFGLSGRAGLDAGLSISYNSLVWTKAGNVMVFDADNANVSPGFRFGMPTFEPSYYDGRTQRFSFLMTTGSGGRVEFRQSGPSASGVYTTADSSYAQLKIEGRIRANDPFDGIKFTVTTTSGTKMRYKWMAGAYKCYEVKDANGNFITVNYNADTGLMTSLVDTLGRVVSVNYDSQLYPVSVTQVWDDGSTHTHATFSYANSPTVNTNFAAATTSGGGVVGPSNGSVLKVLSRVTFADGGSARFDYNSYAQVWKVNNYAPDGHKLNYSSVDLENPTGAQTDCPRFNSINTWAENFNNNAETVIPVTYQDGQSFTLPDGSTRTGKIVQTTAPDGVVTNTFYAGSGWDEGLLVLTQDYASEGGMQVYKRSVQTVYTQDDTSLSYILNPRVIETRISDNSNVKRTSVEYFPQDAGNPSVALYGLVKEVKEYDADGTTVLKRRTFDYNLSSAYTSRRILGLISENKLYDGVGALQSKTTFQYDGDENFNGADQNIAPIQHDGTDYGANFIVGRGNLTKTTRWDATSPNSEQDAVKTSAKYNTAGGVVSQTDEINRTVKIGYADVFDVTPSLSVGTFAYPTSITDPANNASTVQYRHDIGAKTRAQSPAPVGQTTGRVSLFAYDGVGRISKNTTFNNGTYTRYEYPASQIYARTFATVTDANNDGQITSADEVISESYLDGAGNVLRTRSENPNSAGNWSGQKFEYDALGRVKRQSVQTEVDNNWNPAGDDLARGWVWTSQEYDWKGRTTKQINTDATNQLISYEGCGCAGGEVVTIQGEAVARDAQPTGTDRRTQRSYSDALGRAFKTETLNWDGGVYQSTVTKLNARDQAVWTKVFAGAAPSDALNSDSCPAPVAGQEQTCQITTATYDGFGRLKTKHLPQQSANKSTLYDYFDDDRVRTITDARGATTTYTYENRGLVESVVSSMPAGSNLSQLPDNPYPDGDPPGNPVPTNRLPVGFLDSIDPVTHVVKGWSVDPDQPGASNTVHIYLDGPYGSGPQIATVTANVPRPDVNAAHPSYTGNHGFEFTIPSQYFDGQQHRIFVYGIDSVVGNDPKLLERSGLPFYASKYKDPSRNTVATFAYDALGNRTAMTDEMGSKSYEYDELSHLTGETRRFTETLATGSQLALADAPLTGNGFKITYGYNAAGGLKSVTDPFGEKIDYSYDKTGRLKNVTGTDFGGVTNYADDARYRAFGGLKSLHYGNGVQMTKTFNDNLQVSGYELTGVATGAPNGTYQIMKKSYDYYADGGLRRTTDLQDARFSRLNVYDFAGRIKEGRSGAESDGVTVMPTNEQANSLPYRQSYEYNPFNDLTKRDNRHWGKSGYAGKSFNLSYNMVNARVVGEGWSYDADGRVLHTGAPDEESSATYNAAGRLIRNLSGVLTGTSVDIYVDADGGEVRRRTAQAATGTCGEANSICSSSEEVKYYIRSSVFGGSVLSEASKTGRKVESNVIAAGTVVAKQMRSYDANDVKNDQVFWQHADASGQSVRTTSKMGNALTFEGFDGAPAELDPMGGNAGLTNPYIVYSGGGGGNSPREPEYPQLRILYDDSPVYVNGQRVSYSLDGISVSHSIATSALQNGSAVQCPYNYCGPQVFSVNGRNILSSPFTAYADGRSGYNLYLHYTQTTVGVVNEDGSVTPDNNPRRDYFYDVAPNSFSLGSYIPLRLQFGPGNPLDPFEKHSDVTYPSTVALRIACNLGNTFKDSAYRYFPDAVGGGFSVPVLGDFNVSITKDLNVFRSFGKSKGNPSDEIKGILKLAAGNLKLGYGANILFYNTNLDEDSRDNVVSGGSVSFNAGSASIVKSLPLEGNSPLGLQFNLSPSVGVGISQSNKLIDLKPYIKPSWAYHSNCNF